MNWNFISFSVEMGGQEDTQELRGCKFVFPMQMSSSTCSLYCAGVGLCLLQGMHWLINYGKLAFCTADPYRHKSHIGADVRLISCLLSTAHQLQAQAMEVGLEAARGLIFVSFVV